MAIDPAKKRAALIATVTTLPILLIIGFALVESSSGSTTSSSPSSSGVVQLPPVAVPAPPVTDPVTVSTCAQVISALPLTLGGQNLRLTTSTPASPSIVAWGDPAVVLRCGVDKPTELSPSYTDQLIDVNGVLFLHTAVAGGDTFTVVDRAVYVELSVPSNDAQAPLGPIANAVLGALPTAVCVSGDSATADLSTYCTRRT